MKLTKMLSKSIPAWRNPDAWIYLLVFFLILLGLSLVTHYGVSWDEPARYQYAENSLSVYLGSELDLTDEKGAFFGMLAALGAELFDVVPGWIPMDGWHLMSYLAFMMGVYFFYRLCRRLVDPLPAMAATLLFATQPVIWGHSFINPKDIPFMAFFIASVSLGLDVADRFKPVEDGQGIFADLKTSFQRLPNQLRQSWRDAARWKKSVVIVGSVLMVAGFVFYTPLKNLVIEGFEDVYFGRTQGVLERIFTLIVDRGNLSPVDYYTSRIQNLSVHLTLGIELFLLVVVFLTARSIFPWLIDHVVIAGCFLGLCSDIRTLGPASGGLVVVYFLVRAGKKAIPTILKYLVSAFITMYIFWPYLWDNPVGNYLASLSQAQSFPWDGFIQFQGVQYTKTNLPANFLPTIMSLQLTEPALILIGLGTAYLVYTIIRRRREWLDALLLVVWFIAPIVAAILGHSTIYNNFRQFLFVIPPLFIITAVIFQQIWRVFKKKQVWFSLLAVAAILPGVYWNVVLHPYEYIYYNSLVGGVSGAFRDYESDYWCTSYKAAMEYVNQVAPQGATVAVYGPISIARIYARLDLNLVVQADNSLYQPDLVVLSSKWDHDLTDYPQVPVVFSVVREDAVLVVVKNTSGLFSEQ